MQSENFRAARVTLMSVSSMTNQIIRFRAVRRYNFQSFAGELLQKSIEILELCVFNDDFASAIVVLNVDLETECSLQLLLDFPNVRIDWRRSFRLLLCAPFGMQ